jgi:hypothetical protein
VQTDDDERGVGGRVLSSPEEDFTSEYSESSKSSTGEVGGHFLLPPLPLLHFSLPCRSCFQPLEFSGGESESKKVKQRRVKKYTSDDWLI